MRKRESESNQRQGERKKITKILNTSTCAFMHNFTPTDIGVFWSKYVK